MICYQVLDFHCLNHTEHLYSKNYFSGVQLKKCKLASATDGGKALLTNGYPTLAREKEIWIPAVSIPFLVLELEKWAIEHAAELAKPRV